MSDETGLTRRGEFVILSGSALRMVLKCVLIAIRLGKMSGLSTQSYKALACELYEAMSHGGQTDMRPPAISKSVAVDQPSVPIAEVAERLGISDRHARRLAPKLGGRKIAGSWFADELALRQHIEGTK